MTEQGSIYTTNKPPGGTILAELGEGDWVNAPLTGFEVERATLEQVRARIRNLEQALMGCACPNCRANTERFRAEAQRLGRRDVLERLAAR